MRSSSSTGEAATKATTAFLEVPAEHEAGRKDKGGEPEQPADASGVRADALPLDLLVDAGLNVLEALVQLRAARVAVDASCGVLSSTFQADHGKPFFVARRYFQEILA